MTKPIVAAIVAMDEARVIGNQGALPWRLPQDMARFRKLTTGHTVIMGRKTWDSLPEKFRPLPDRLNIVVTRNRTSVSSTISVKTVASPQEALEVALRDTPPERKIWIIGGAEIYGQTLSLCDEVHVTHVYGIHVGDSLLAPFEGDFSAVEREAGEGCEWVTYKRAPHS